MSKKLAIVTGANKGLGFAIVKGLCEKYDGEVYLTARDEKRGTDACDELRKLGLKPRFHQLDVTDQESISKFCTHIQQQGEVDILVNNAGIFIKNDGKEKANQAEQMLSVNFLALITFTEAILPLMNDGGKIVNISSSSGHLSRIPSENLKKRINSPDLSLEDIKQLIGSYVDAVKENKEIEDGWGDNHYVVSKVGVNAYTYHLQRRLAGRGIIVNCVHPGYVMTDMTSGAGNITPEDAAEIPVWLALAPKRGGLFVWSNGETVPWDGPDPRGWIDGKLL